MRNRFDRQLDRLNVEMIGLGALCEEMITDAGKVVSTKDKETIESMISIEEEINQKEREIESLCMKLLLQQQPVARDLRLISAALKMVSDMERIGDQGGDIAGIVQQRSVVKVIADTHIANMARATIKMVTKSVDSFVKKDLEAARKVLDMDDEVDDLFEKVKKEVIQLIHEDPEKGEECVAIVMIAKYFERIGDHANNIAEWVEYSITGEYKGGSL
ncbi:MAG: phosphate signaling complex protein PhoU [Anaerostipes sp.]|jgi:phosphate transport system protein|nr:phosphate signaling complex protein PhoU [Anaerostipes sp.]